MHLKLTGDDKPSKSQDDADQEWDGYSAWEGEPKWLSSLRQQSERSSERKSSSLRNFSRSLEQVERLTGWALVDSASGEPRLDGWVFLMLCVLVQGYAAYFLIWLPLLGV